MFFTKPKADSGDRSAWGGFWFNPVPARIGSANITPDTALQLTAVYACVRVHANAVSTLPFQMYREKPNGAKEQIRDHWLYRLFAKRPNAYQNPMEFRAMMHGHLELRGNAFAYIVSNGKGEVTDLHPIHPDRITIEMLADAANGAPNWRYRVKNRDGTDVPIARADMFHIKGLSSDGIVGYNPIALARKMLATGAAAQDYGVRFFDNDASPTSGILKHPTHFKDKEQRELFRDSWQEGQSGANKGKVAVLEFGIEYVPPPVVSNADAQFIETKKLNRNEIASLFDVPPHMIGDLERATFSNIEQQSIDYVTNKLRPRVVCWEEAIKYTFLDPEEDDIVVRLPFIELMRGDMAARTAYINTGVMNGTLTRNEGRIMEDRNPIDGLDEPLMMVNMIPVSQQQDEADEEEQAEKDAPPAPPKAPPQNAERLNALALAAAERVARKETQVLLAALKDGDWPMAISEALNRHAQFVAQALGVTAQQATAYTRARWNDPINAGYEDADIYGAALARLTKLALEGTV
jgi:HK97 family phage portal protein